MDFIRAFIAIELNEDIKECLQRVEDLLKGKVRSGVSWANPQGIHLTLQFLGKTPPSKLGEIQKSLGDIVPSFDPFVLRLGELGGFPNLRRPRVIWVGLEGDIEMLNRLQLEISKAMEGLGFPPEERAFKGHLTLGRVRGSLILDDRSLQDDSTIRTELMSTDAFWVHSVSLMRSELTPGGAVYTCLSRAFLNELGGG